MSSRLDDAAVRLRRLADQLPYATVHGVDDELNTVAELANELIGDIAHAELLAAMQSVRSDIVESAMSGLDNVQEALLGTAKVIWDGSNHADSVSETSASRSSPTKADKLQGVKRPRHNRKDLERKFSQLEEKGWVIQKTTGHWTAWCPCGQHRTGFSSTPSGQKDMHRANAALRLDCAGGNR